MAQIHSCFTVYFEEPFWVGLYERWESGRYAVCRVVFGAEPKDYEVYHWLLAHWKELRFSPSLSENPQGARSGAAGNPKRMQRAIQKQLQTRGPSTKAQQAMQLLREQGKESRLSARREQREKEKEMRFSQRQEKRKQKHKGR